MFGLTKIRIVEIGVALLLTLAALLFVGHEQSFAGGGRVPFRVGRAEKVADTVTC